MSTSVIAGITKLIKEVRESDHEETQKMGERLDQMLDLQERRLKLEEAKFEYVKRNGPAAGEN